MYVCVKYHLVLKRMTILTPARTSRIVLREISLSQKTEAPRAGKFQEAESRMEVAWRRSGEWRPSV
jgi:hypothetical protein